VPADEGTPGAPRVVEFVLVAPGASSVAVVGDFNDWDAGASPMRRAADGETWSATVPLTAGHHTYAFVVDGTRWLADPVAPLASGDGFGTPSSVILVGDRDI
jgi:1,4-alpha-glucan branching enzyme